MYIQIHMDSTEETMMEATIFSWWRPFAGDLYLEFSGRGQTISEPTSRVEAHGNDTVLNTFDNHSWKQKKMCLSYYLYIYTCIN